MKGEDADGVRSAAAAVWRGSSERWSLNGRQRSVREGVKSSRGGLRLILPAPECQSLDDGDEDDKRQWVRWE